MGVKLDWNIEAEQGKHKQHKEDFKQRSARYWGVFRLLIAIGIFFIIVGFAVYLVVKRWEQVNTRLEQLLSETVGSEVAALRVGDFPAFIDMQRSATEDWLIAQEQIYHEYQALKSTGNVTLTGRVSNIEVSGQRGRAQVEEIIDGISYTRTWFYWRYEDGWRHVPPDYTFWGEPQTIERDNYVIRYQAVDEATAQILSEQMDRWLEITCSLFGCAALPPITLDIVARKLPQVTWAPNEQNAWQMLLPSPYVERVRTDQPLTSEKQSEAATLLATRIVAQAMKGGLVNFPHDALYLRDATVAWLAGHFVQIDPQSQLISSLIDNYGQDRLLQLLANVQPESNISVLSSVTDTATIAEANLNWHDFVVWRLQTEDELIRLRDEANWLSLYDQRDPGIVSNAYIRFNGNVTAQARTVQEVSRSSAADGTPQIVARVQVTVNNQVIDQLIFFNLVNNNWLRAS